MLVILRFYLLIRLTVFRFLIEAIVSFLGINWIRLVERAAQNCLCLSSPLSQLQSGASSAEVYIN